MPGFALDPALTATSDLEEAVCGADFIIMGVPTSGFRRVLEDAAPYMRPWIPVVSLSKGLERGSHLRMTEVIKQVVPGPPGGRPHRSQHRLGDPGRQGRRRGDRHRGPRGGQRHPGRVHPGRVPGLHQRRRDRLRAGRGAEERDRHRRGHRRGTRRRRQHPGRGHVPWTGRADPARRGHGGQGRHLRRPGRHGRPDRHLRQPPQPQPPGGRAAGQGPQARGHPRRDAHGGRRGEHGQGGPRAGRDATASTSRSAG